MPQIQVEFPQTLSPFFRLPLVRRLQKLQHKLAENGGAGFAQGSELPLQPGLQLLPVFPLRHAHCFGFLAVALRIGGPASGKRRAPVLESVGEEDACLGIAFAKRNQGRRGTLLLLPRDDDDDRVEARQDDGRMRVITGSLRLEQKRRRL